MRRFAPSGHLIGDPLRMTYAAGVSSGSQPLIVLDILDLNIQEMRFAWAGWVTFHQCHFECTAAGGGTGAFRVKIAGVVQPSCSIAFDSADGTGLYSPGVRIPHKSVRFAAGQEVALDWEQDGSLTLDDVCGHVSLRLDAY